MGIAAVAGAMGLVGSAVQAAGNVEADYAASNAAMYQAAVAKNNAIIAEQNAAEASEAGLAQAGIVSLKGAEALSKVKAAQAASGVDVNSGSAVDVRAGQRMAGQLDAETVLHNAELVNYGYRAKATGFEAESELDIMKAKYAKEAGWLGAGAGIIGNASSIGFKLGKGGDSNPTDVGSATTTDSG